jgi:putative ABC transport system permease protein
MKAIGDLPQVAEAMPVRLKMTNCMASTDVVAVHGVDKDLFTRFHDYDLDPADLAAFRADTSGALVGRRIAARYGWKPGQRVTLQELGDINFTVRGLYAAGDASRDHLILVGRRFLQEADDEQGVSHQVFVRLRPGADAEESGRAIDALAFTVPTTTQREDLHRAAALDQLQDIARVGNGVVVGVILVILLAVGNAIAMAARERVREFAVMRTLGFPRRAVAFLVLGEGALLALAGSVAGCAAVQALISARLVTAVATCGLTVELLGSPLVWAASLGAVTLAGLAGSVLPAWSSARLEITAALRQED